MITLQCDACDKTFEVDSKEAGGKVPCPFCGDVNRVPEQPAAPAGRPGSDEDEPFASDEKQITVIRPAMFRAHPFRFLIIFLIFAGGIALMMWSWLAAAIGAWVAIIGAVLAVIGAGAYFFWWLNTRFWIKAVVTNKRTIRHEGVIRRHTTEVLHDHVRSVDINQNFVQRIFNVGYIGIDSAGQEDIEIEIRDIPGPYRVKEIIDRYRKM